MTFLDFQLHKLLSKSETHFQKSEVILFWAAFLTSLVWNRIVERLVDNLGLKDCEERPLKFRAEQCAKFDNSPFQNRYYSWVPFTKGKQTSPCALACKPEGRQWYSELAPQVIDGTRCHDDGESTDVCIRGKCHVSFTLIRLPLYSPQAFEKRINNCVTRMMLHEKVIIFPFLEGFWWV